MVNECGGLQCMPPTGKRFQYVHEQGASWTLLVYEDAIKPLDHIRSGFKNWSSGAGALQ
jgi:hypothetical protein